MADSKKYNGSTWEHSLRKLGTATDTLTTLPADVYADGNNATVGLVGNMQQTGTPTPQNPIQPQECGDLETVGEKAGQYKIPISSASTTTPVYLGEVESERNIKQLVLTGQENWTTANGGTENCFFYVSLSDAGISTETPCISSHYQQATINNTSTDIGVRVLTEQLRIRHTNASTTSKSDFMAYLQQQYANGTPVTIWYVLATPETGIVNEPIRKIGNYVDTISGITIPTITGKDTFDVDTTLKPSEVSLSYTGWHDATVKDKSKNLWNEDYTDISSTAKYVPINVGEGNFTLSTTFQQVNGVTDIFLLSGNVTSGISSSNNGAYAGKNVTKASIDGYVTIAYRNYARETAGSIPTCQTMLNSGSTALSYEPYWQ